MVDKNSQGFSDLEKLNKWRRYQATLSFVLCAAINKICPQAGVRIEHSISHGLYFMIDENITHSGLRSIEAEMKAIINQGHQIRKTMYPKHRARVLFARHGQKDKVLLIANTRRQNIPVYSLLGMHDTYAIQLFDSTSSVPLFGIERFSPGFVLMLPTWHDLSTMPAYTPKPKLARIFNEYENWAHILGIDTVGELNQSVKKGKGPDIVKVSEALHEKKIVYIADRIIDSTARKRYHTAHHFIG
jgi:uridine kinase